MNINSNHPSCITRNIPLAVNKRLSEISSNERIFTKAAPPYQEALDKSGYKFNLKYAHPTRTYMENKALSLDLKIRRFVHSKEWEARLCEGLMSEHMKPRIVKACPKIQIGGMPRSSSVEHLVTLKTRMYFGKVISSWK